MKATYTSYISHLRKKLPAGPGLLTCLTALLCLLPLTACQDDDFQLPSQEEDAPYGLPASLTLSYTVPEQEVKSRSEMPNDDVVDDLWVGVFSLDPSGGNYGKLVYKKTFYAQVGLNDAQLPSTKIIKINPPSGKSLIVGIANTTVNSGIMEGTDQATEMLISNILASWQTGTTTLDDYLRLASVVSDHQVNWSTGRMVMSGEYTSTNTGDHLAHQAGDFFPDDADWNTALNNNKLPGVVNILPGNNTAKGYIRLCRHLAYSKFNIGTTAPDMKITLRQWEVKDLPQISLMGERKGVNGGDVLNGLDKPGGRGAYSESEPSNHYETGKMTATNSQNQQVANIDALTFDFYTLNNRRTGLSHVDSYKKREEEYKTTGGANGGLNTGVFKSLVSEENYNASLTASDEQKKTLLRPGKAPYVVMHLTLDYWVAPNASGYDNPATPLTAVAANTPGAVKRYAEVQVVVHLGYVDPTNDAVARAKDFNVNRNTKYTYNVTVNGVDDIRVEAIGTATDPEPAPSLEGKVNDTDQRYVELDGHYAVFNVYLTNAQRKNLRYTVDSPFGVEGASKHTFSSDDIDVAVGNTPNTLAATAATNRDNWWHDNDRDLRQFRDWIRIVPTTAANVLAPYPGDENQAATTAFPAHNNQLLKPYWTLDEFLDWENHKGLKADGSVSTADNDVCYYTVFVNEYVYYNDETGQLMTPKDCWKNYVNHTGGRSCSLRVQPEYTSSDKESVYSHSIIYIQQNSITTYYAVKEDEKFTAGSNLADYPLGVERVNETYGLNMLWTQNVPTDGLSAYNGRYNAWKYLDLLNNARPKWSDYVDQAQAQHVGVINESRFGLTDVPASTATLPALKPKGTETANSGYHQWFPSPSDPNYYEVMSMAMSRNRDLNGDGLVDPEEVRWVVPSKLQMEMMVIGTISLRPPLVDYNNKPRDIKTGWDDNNTNVHHPYGEDERQNGILHYVTSSAVMLWADQHMVMGGTNEVVNTGSGVGNTRGHYWQVRCVRLLGNRNVGGLENNPYFQTTPSPNSRNYTQAVNSVWDADKSIGKITADFLNRRNVIEPTVKPFPFHTVAVTDANTSSRFFYFAAPVQVTIPAKYAVNNAYTNESWRNYVNAIADGSETNPIPQLVGTKTIPTGDGWQRAGKRINQGWRMATFQEFAMMFLVNEDTGTVPDSWDGRNIFTVSGEDFLNPRRALGQQGSKLNSLPDSDVKKDVNDQQQGHQVWVLPVCDDCDAAFQ